jgi:isopentenyl-diphosphate delta-isomerase
MQIEKVILVNEDDEAIGSMEKMEAHEKALLHRAFSVFVFNGAGKLLLQRRALDKYHSGGLWTNTCCSHPREGETVDEAAHRRLHEEMGMDCELVRKFSFIYKATLDHGLTEHELDHVLVGTTDQVPVINPEEVAEYSYVDVGETLDDLVENPQKYTAWFAICFPRLVEESSPLD